MKIFEKSYRLLGALVVGTLLLAGSPGSLLAEGESAKPTVSLSQRLNHYNLGDGSVALSGYDPVSYFNAGPHKGQPNIKKRYNGVNYLFANEANRKLFEADPEKYEPAYGGWCAWAMFEGKKYEVDPENYKIVDGRNLLFYKGWTGDTLKKWNNLSEEKGEVSLTRSADTNWGKTIAK